MKTALAAALALVLLFTAGPGWCEQSIDVAVGDGALHLPVPQGFLEISAEAPGALARVAAQSKEVRVLTLFTTQKDLAGFQKDKEYVFRRSLHAAVVRGQEGKLAPSTFKSVVQGVRKAYGVLAEKGALQAKLDQALKDASKRGEIIPIGIYAESDFVVGALRLEKAGISLDAEGNDFTAVSTAIYARADNRNVVAIFSAKYDSPRDLDWLLQASRAWADGVVAANPSQPDAVAEGQGASGAASYWEVILDKIQNQGAGSWALLAVALGALYMLFRRK